MPAWGILLRNYAVKDPGLMNRNRFWNSSLTVKNWLISVVVLQYNASVVRKTSRFLGARLSDLNKGYSVFRWGITVNGVSRHLDSALALARILSKASRHVFADINIRTNDSWHRTRISTLALCIWIHFLYLDQIVRVSDEVVTIALLITRSAVLVRVEPELRVLILHFWRLRGHKRSREVIDWCVVMTSIK